MRNCPACHSTQATRIGEKNSCTVHQCAACETYYVSHYDPAASAAIYNDYKPTEGYISKPDKKLRRARQRLARLKKQFGGKSFLDVGCNVGFAVAAAREQGYEAHGHDLDPVAIEQARKLFPDCTFHTGDLAAIARKFDLIYCAEVIEHVPDPHSFAAQLAALLNPGGALFMTTPDSGHWRRDRNFMQWREVIPPEHLTWFNRKSLADVLGKSGFADIRYRFNFKPGLRAFARRA